MIKYKFGGEMSRAKIAVIDDDIYIGNLIEELLRRENYTIFRAYSGTEAVMLFEKITPDLILLDLMLPGLSGEELLPKIKGIPVIVVSAKADAGSKVQLLLGGAADYITKPFNTQELIARVKARLRESDSHQNARNLLVFDTITLDLSTYQVTAGAQAVKLTKTEYAILKVLLQNSNVVLSKNMILESIESETPDCVESSLKTHIGNLRSKLRTAAGKDYIEAIWGIGYKLKS